jgi:ATP-dependent Lhr-like helicase
VYVVVDELHAFIGTERGRQLQSLLHRVELAIRRAVPRIALSATLGDMRLAAAFLRPEAPERVKLIAAGAEGTELRLQLRGYRMRWPREEALGQPVDHARGVALVDAHEASADHRQAIAQHLFKTLRGADNLIFANSRSRVEEYADYLRRLSEAHDVPNEFLPHHGSLSRELREDVEARLKDRARPVTVLCTTTLEMGIDIGDMNAIAQLGAPPSVASLRQRLGRSGRRGGAAVRVYVAEEEVTEESPLQDALRAELVQTIAMVQLLLASWYEPPTTGALHLSTLVQQMLSLIAQVGGVRADEAWRALCQVGGPFTRVDASTFMVFLRCLGEQDLIQQAPSGELLLGVRGEQLVNHHNFFTAFTTPAEYQLLSDGRPLGTLPIDSPVDEGTYLIFAGRRWRVLSVDEEHHVIDLAPAAGGRVPTFSGEGGLVHDRVRQEMFAVYVSADVPVYLDRTARDLLAEGRAYFKRYQLGTQSLVERGRETLLLCWRGDRILDTIQVILQQRGVRIQRDGFALTAQGIGRADLLATMRDVVAAGVPDATTLAATVKNRRAEKYDRHLTYELMALEYAGRHLDVHGARETLAAIVESSTTNTHPPLL